MLVTVRERILNHGDNIKLKGKHKSSHLFYVRHNSHSINMLLKYICFIIAFIYLELTKLCLNFFRFESVMMTLVFIIWESFSSAFSDTTVAFLYNHLQIKMFFFLPLFYQYKYLISSPPFGIFIVKICLEVTFNISFSKRNLKSSIPKNIWLSSIYCSFLNLTWFKYTFIQKS